MTVQSPPSFFFHYRDFRRKRPNQILINFCIASSGMLIAFLAAPATESSKSSSLVWCKASAVSLHYFLLAAFLWMAVEAFNMYRAFVKVIPAASYPSKFMLKSCLFAWGNLCFSLLYPKRLLTMQCLFLFNKELKY